MPIFNHTPPIAEALGAAGKASATADAVRAQRRQQMMQETDWRDRRAALEEERQFVRQERARSNTERDARLAWAQRRLMLDQARALRSARSVQRADAQMAGEFERLSGPVLGTAVGAGLRAAASQVPQAIQNDLRETQALMARMSPDDAERLLAERAANAKAATMQYESQRVLRDIEDAWRNGLFGEDEAASQTYQNAIEVARADPIKGRELLNGVLQSASRIASQNRARARMLGKADQLLAAAEGIGVSDQQLLQAESMIAEFETNPNMDPEGFMNNLRSKLFSSNERPQVYVHGLDKQIPDYSGWSKGGYVEDMTERQRRELRSVAGWIVRRELEVERKADDPLASIMPAEEGAAPEKSVDQRIDEKVADLLAMHGWVAMPEEEQFRRAFYDPLLGGDEGWKQAYGQMVQGRKQAEQDQIRQRAEWQGLPKWNTADTDLQARAVDTVKQALANGLSENEGRAAVAALGINPDSIPMDALTKGVSATKGSAHTAKMATLTEELAAVKDYPLADEGQKAEIERKIAGERETVVQRKQLQGDFARAVSIGRDLGYQGTLAPAVTGMSSGLTEVYRRWLEQRAQQETDPKRKATIKQIAKTIKRYQEEYLGGTLSKLTDEQLRSRYFEETKATRSREQMSRIGGGVK